ncbi:MAG: beta-ketoacyl-ACP synthase II [Oligoflexales bacterium]|nr:beta-ketoacyl-ACP synthase II [Oligoflexales bacterium]
MKRVVITGVGTVCPVGLSTMESWDAILAGKCGVGLISLFDPEDLPVKIAAEVKNFNPVLAMDVKEAGRTTRFIQLAVSAANEAVLDSGFDFESNCERHGSSIGVGMGALSYIEDNVKILIEKGAKRVSPFFIPMVIPNMAAGFITVKYHLCGPSLCPATACASGSHAIGEGYRYIVSDLADVMVCGGAESVLSPVGLAGFASMKALSRRNDSPETASRPFDLDRDGFVMGEGAGILVLEELDHALRRGAKIYAEMVGYGITCDAYHITAPSPDGYGGKRCMLQAMESGGIGLEDVGYINAHGTSTKLNDKLESAAIESIFKEKVKNVSISSTKGATGHCIGAAGAIEAIFSILAIRDRIVPPTINYETRDPECRLDYTPNFPREKNIEISLSNSFGFGGVNATLAFKKYS